MSYTSPEPCNLSRDQISTLAEQIARELNYVIGSDPVKFVEKIGGEVFFQDLWEMSISSSGSIVIDGINNFKIYLGLHTSSRRDRFTIGHELGHYFLHYLLPYSNKQEVGPLQAARYGDGRTEYEANWFSSAFLMPKEKFKEKYHESIYLDEVADYFGVSRSAAEIRSKILNLSR